METQDESYKWMRVCIFSGWSDFYVYLVHDSFIQSYLVFEISLDWQLSYNTYILSVWNILRLAIEL